MKIVACLLCWLALTSLALASPVCRRPLTVGWDTWPPYHVQDKKGQMQGFAVEILNEMSQRAACTLLFRQTPWTRSLKELASGETDIVMEALQTPEREKIARFSLPYSPTLIRLWVREKDALQWKFQTLEELSKLAPFPIGVVRSDSYGPELDQWLKQPPPGIRTDPAPTVKSNLLKLAYGRVPIIVGNEAVMQAVLAGMPDKTPIIPLPPQWHIQDAHFAFSRRSVDEPTFMAFQQALESMQRDKTYTRIYQKYFPAPLNRPAKN